MRPHRLGDAVLSAEGLDCSLQQALEPRLGLIKLAINQSINQSINQFISQSIIQASKQKAQVCSQAISEKPRDSTRVGKL